jgi:hypothetical protein
VIPKPSDWKLSTFASLNLPVNDTLQGFVVQPDGSILASQGLPQSSAAGALEDSYVSLHRRTPSGSAWERIGTMVGTGGGHATVLGLYAQDVFIVDFRGVLLKVPFVPGTKYDAATEYRWGGRFQAGAIHCATDLTYRNALFVDATLKTVVLRTIADVDAGVDRPLGRVPALTNKDAEGLTTLRQGWASWGLQLLYLIGQHDRSRELQSYDLVTGRRLWYVNAKLCWTEPWSEPEGVTVLPSLAGQPAILVGYTNRIYSGEKFTRRHVIRMLRDPASHQVTDLGYFTVLEKVTGYRANGSVVATRAPGYRLWIEKRGTYNGVACVVTAFGTFYEAAKVKADPEA